MAATEELVGFDGPIAAPYSYQLPPDQALTPSVVCATFDGTAAAGAFLPCLSIYSQDGRLLSRTFPGSVAAGDVAEVTYGPFLKVPSSFTPGSGAVEYIQVLGAGVWVPPSGARIATVVCVGGAGGGGSGTGTNAGGNVFGGGGGGGGAAFSRTYDLFKLAVLFPAGVPYFVGPGGNGGAGALNSAGNAGAVGVGTTFGTTMGLQQAGGGTGGGTGGVGGGGGSQTPPAAGLSGAFPSGGVNGVGIQSGDGGTNSTGASTEWGGAGGGASGGSNGGNTGGYEGGSSLYGGCGGGGGAGCNPNAFHGGRGGQVGSYLVKANGRQGGGANGRGTFVGPFCGTGGDGGDSVHAANGAVAGLVGQDGSFGSGGGGGGAASTSSGGATGGTGGQGGNGQIVIFLS